MGELTGLMSVTWLVLEVALVLAIPVAIIEGGFAGLRRIAPEGFFAIPVMSGLSKLLGMTVGVVLMSTHYDRQYFDLHALFTPESPWNLSLRDFLLERVNPFTYGLGPVFDHLESSPVGGGLAFGIGLSVILLAALAVAPFVFWNVPTARRGVVCALLTAALVTYLTIYLVCVLMWVLYLLNFWTFAILLIAFQYYRYRA